MAAEAVVTFFFEKLNTLITEEANLLQGVDEEVRLLQNELEWISLFVREADEKRRSDPKVRLWVKQLRQITFHAEDVLDEFILKVDDQRRRNLGGFVGSLKSCIICTRQLPLLHDLRNQIKVINTMTEKISANQSKYGIQLDNQVIRRESSFHSSNEEKRPPISEDYDVVGTEDGMKKVKSILLEGGVDKRRRAVVSVVGMGGLGKTTLAKKVYNNSDVKKHFDCFAWVSASQEFRLTELLQAIIKDVSTLSKEELEDLKKLDEERLRQKLREYLQQGDHNKYLIVLDDIWNVKDWNGLNTAFPGQLNGSRILLTTRKEDVALHADPNNIHKLRFLTPPESWDLFLKKVFPQESKCPSELQALGEEMVTKCSGLPLAVVVLGGLLSSKEKTETIWFKLNASLKWNLANGAGSNYSCSEILTMSYYDLPYYLKPCFMYMGLFLEDHEISASKLFQYWIAQGFVQRRGEESMEDVAEDYLEELIHRIMIQVGSWRYDGRVKCCRVHDLLRDLAIAEAKEDQFFQVYERINESSAKSDKYVRRLTIHGLNPEDLRYFSDQFRYTRSLMCFEMNPIDSKQFYRFKSGCFKLLKVLELGVLYMGIETPSLRLPKAIGDLIHLKYLGVSGDVVIPNSIIKLVNLQTLNIRHCHVECIPIQFWTSLRQLRHLKLDTVHFRLKSSITNCDISTNLQTLHVDSSFGINGGSLGKLRMLKKLKIFCYFIQIRKEILDSVVRLTGLRSLTLILGIWEEFTGIQSFSRHNYLTKLNLHGRLPSYTKNFFPPALFKLTLSYSKIESEGMVHDLARLQNLKFLMLSSIAYMGKKLVFPQGGFLRLQFMKLGFLTEVEELIVEEGALISLTHLEIYYCEKLKMIPDGMRQLTTLEELRVERMPKEFMDRLLENGGEDWEKIKHIPSVVIKQ